MTLSLPKHRLDSLHQQLQHMLTITCTSRRKWQKLLGTLRSTTPALYGATHLFSILQHALTDTTNKHIHITPLLRNVLRHWIQLANQAHVKPAPLHTVVPTPPTILAATDASKAGMGGGGSGLQLQRRLSPLHSLSFGAKNFRPTSKMLSSLPPIQWEQLRLMILNFWP